MSDSLELFALDGIPEVAPGDDLSEIMLHSAEHRSIQMGDIVVITQKIVSKAEGRLLSLRTVRPSEFAIQWAAQWDKDPRMVEVVLRESKRIVRMDHGIMICETKHGFVCANAGVDASNVSGEDVVCLLPEDPDASAMKISQALSKALGFTVPVVITDSFGRPWRKGIINIAIGAAQLAIFADYRGKVDTGGHELRVTVLAIADEIASAAELLSRKLDKRPVVIVRGYMWESAAGSAQELVMPPEQDMFR